MSSVARDALRALGSATQVASSVEGEPLVAGELVVPVLLPRPDGNESNVNARGIGPQSFAIRPIVRLIAGRPPKVGTNEIALGEALVGRSPGPGWEASCASPSSIGRWWASSRPTAGPTSPSSGWTSTGWARPSTGRGSTPSSCGRARCRPGMPSSRK
ncbi:hypothetical protein ACN28S_22475 [Cystobacter fuscus]